MNKIISIFAFIFLLFSSSCSYFDDERLGERMIVALSKHIEKKEKEQIKDMFSTVVKDNVENLDEQIDELCVFVQGRYNKIESRSHGVQTSYSVGKIEKDMDLFYTINMTDFTYYYYVRYMPIDDINEDNIGIWSIVVEEKIGDKEMSPIRDLENGITIRK